MVVIVPSSKAMSDATVLVTERTRKPIDHSSPAQRLFRDLKPKLLMRKRDQTKHAKRIFLVTKSTAHDCRRKLKSKCDTSPLLTPLYNVGCSRRSQTRVSRRYQDKPQRCRGVYTREAPKPEIGK